MQRYLYSWLLLVGVGHVLLGLAFILVAKTSLIDPYLSYLYVVFSIPSDTSLASNANESLLRTILQLFGPTIASWGALFCIAVSSYMRLGDQRIKMGIILALLIWFMIDCSLSVLNGINAHLVINILACISILPPLVMLKPNTSIN
ncbi:hypothetical protein A9Q99_23510 [Gammaproteobacteria bacterium 45_16_T64]|nr:hypothetical protein A9Q99_23510 [Gammaproteobacteria bacterium 45_16_T64]